VSSRTRRRVVITGLGAVTPVGIGVKAFWQALRDGVSGIDTITRFDARRYPCRVAGEVKGFEPFDFMEPKQAATTGRFTQMAIAAARMAYDDAGLASVPGAARFMVCFGSSAHAIEAENNFETFLEHGMRSVSPSILLESAGHAATGHVSTALGLTGQTMTLSSACTTGIDVVQWSYHQIAAGLATGVLAGATEAPLSAYSHAAFTALGVLSQWPGKPAHALRPFDAFADGLVLGEGAGAFVFEELDHARARDAHVYAEVLGFGGATEGVGLRVVDPTGAALQHAIAQALQAARLEATEIDAISAHGNGLPDYDRAESAAYRAALGSQAHNIPVSSIKPMTGQSLAAAGALQVVAGCFTLDEQFVPPTLNHDVPAPTCDLDYVPYRGRPARVNRLLIAAHAMGGTNSALVLGRAPAD
jgi:3-oxoacyl-[acyl-carrier-protein] synthase II